MHLVFCLVQSRFFHIHIYYFTVFVVYNFHQFAIIMGFKKM